MNIIACIWYYDLIEYNSFKKQMVFFEELRGYILKFVKDNTYGINQQNISPEKKIDKLLLRFSAICGAVAVQPIPFADIFIIWALNENNELVEDEKLCE